MDEPFSALDPLSREQLQQDVISLKEKSKTFVFVTHDMSEAMTLGDRICLMKDGEIVQVGTPEEFIQKPKNEFVKHLLEIKEILYLRHWICLSKKVNSQT